MTETAWRSIGGLLQLAGVALIFVGVYRTRMRLPGFVGFRVRVRRFWRWVTRQKPPVVSMSGSIGPLGLSVRGELSVPANWDSLTDSERIEELRTDLGRLRKRLADSQAKTSERFKTLEDRIQDTQQTLEQRLRVLEAKMNSLVGDDLHLEAWGAGLFFLGICFATWAEELSRLF